MCVHLRDFQRDRLIRFGMVTCGNPMSVLATSPSLFKHTMLELNVSALSKSKHNYRSVLSLSLFVTISKKI